MPPYRKRRLANARVIVDTLEGGYASPMTRQNRTLGFLVLFSIGLLALLLWGAGLFSGRTEVTEEKAASPSEAATEGGAGPESMGDPVVTTAEPTSAPPTEAEKSFAQILQDLEECFGIKSPESGAAAAKISVDTLLAQLQSDWGPPVRIEDRWMSWHLRNREGRERRLRLEVTENDEGRTTRELHYYAIDREGLPIPLELDPEKSLNPSDETLNQMLREGDVFFKERAGVVQFSGNERIDFVNIDGTLAEIEVVKGDSIFRCVNLKAREACSCVK